MTPKTDLMFVTGRVIANGMRPEWAVCKTDFAIDPGSIDAPEILPAGSWMAPLFEDSSFPAYPRGARRDCRDV